MSGLPTATCLAFCAALGAAITLPAIAQDMNTLNRHLETQQWNRLQDHQNRNRTAPPRQRRQAATDCSAAALPAAERRRMQAEYGRRVLSQGQAAADLWAREQGRRFRASRAGC